MNRSSHFTNSERQGPTESFASDSTASHAMTQLPFAPAYPNSQPNVIYGQAHTARGTPYANPITARTASQSGAVYAEVYNATSSAVGSTPIYVPEDAVQVLVRPKPTRTPPAHSCLPSIPSSSSNLTRPSPTAVIVTEHSSDPPATTNRAPRLEEKSLQRGLMRCCLMMGCCVAFCVMLPLLTTSALVSRVAGKQGITTPAQCFSSVPNMYSPNVYINGDQGNKWTVSLTKSTTDQYVAPVEVVYNWYRQPCESCYLFMGLNKYGAVVCSSLTSETDSVQMTVLESVPDRQSWRRLRVVREERESRESDTDDAEDDREKESEGGGEDPSHSDNDSDDRSSSPSVFPSPFLSQLSSQPSSPLFVKSSSMAPSLSPSLVSVSPSFSSSSAPSSLQTYNSSASKTDEDDVRDADQEEENDDDEGYNDIDLSKDRDRKGRQSDKYRTTLRMQLTFTQVGCYQVFATEVPRTSSKPCSSIQPTSGSLIAAVWVQSK